MTNFYVYILLDPRQIGLYLYPGLDYQFQFEPFYIGKGTGQRCHIHTKQRVLNKSSYPVHSKIKNIIKEYKEPIVLKFKTDISEEEAFELEKLLIKQIGRFDLGLGPLSNLTDGGEGFSNHRRPCLTEEHKLRIGNALRGKPKSQEHRDKMSQRTKGNFGRKPGQKHTKETLEKLKDKASLRKGKTFEEFYGDEKAEEIKNKMRQRPCVVGRTHTEETKKILSEKAKENTGEKARNAKSWMFISPTGEQFLIKGEFRSFCAQNNLSVASMQRVAYKKQESHKEWKVSLCD